MIPSGVENDMYFTRPVLETKHQHSTVPPVINMRVAPKVMPPIYFHGNNNIYKEHNNAI
jgi:hypothetical protein